MKVNTKLLLLILLMSFITTLGKDPEWLIKTKKIVLLQSNREDARSLFGKPVEEKESLIEYFDLEDGRISVIYSSGLCVAKTEGNITRTFGWKVPKYTVIEIGVYLKNPISPEELGADLSDFESYNVEDVSGAIIYENDKTGVSYTVLKGKIKEVNFTPKESLKYLYCN